MISMNRYLTSFTCLGLLLVAFSGCQIRTTAVPEPPTEVTIPTEPKKIPAPNPAALELPAGYRAEIVISDLIYPSSIEIDDAGNLYVAEAGFVYGDHYAPARIWGIAPAGEIKLLTTELDGPVNDLLWHEGRLFISHRGRISELQADGQLRHLVTGLPSYGDHQNNQMSIGPDGKLYFGQGTVTNSGVVGLDNFLYLWLPLYPQIHDQPAKALRLRGKKYLTANPWVLAGFEELPLQRTSAFHRFGKTGDEVSGTTKANGTILRVNLNGSDLEVYAWGLRNPFGVIWSSDGQLYAAENGFDQRGSRPIANDTDDLYVIREGAWYGWPDYAAGIPVTNERFHPEDGPEPEFIMKDHPPVEQPLLTFPVHAGVTKLAVDPGSRFAPDNGLLLAVWGPLTPLSGYISGKRPDHGILRIDLSKPGYTTLIKNKDGIKHGTGAGLRRPLDVLVAPDGQALYIVDMGAYEVLSTRVPLPQPYPGTGLVWRILPPGVESSGPPAGLSVLPGR